MIARQLASTDQVFDDLQPRTRAVSHPNGDSPIEFDNRRWLRLQQPVVQRYDLFPVGFFPACRTRMTAGDCGLNAVGTNWLVTRKSLFQVAGSAVNQQPVPACAVLLLQQDRTAVAVEPGRKAGCLELKKGRQPEHFPTVGHKARQAARQSQRLFA
jgi:hypothetical protein